MRRATLNDLDYIAKSLIDLSLFIKAQGSNIYIDNLPEIVDDFTLKIAKDILEDKNSLTLIYEINSKAVACISATIDNTSFYPSRIGKVAFVGMCWVDEEYRGKNIASKLLSKIEKWAKQYSIKTLELSYVVENLIAKNAWRKMGFKPFRTFAYKSI